MHLPHDWNIQSCPHMLDRSWAPPMDPEGCRLTQSIHKAKRHHQAEIARRITPAFWFDGRCTLGSLEGELHLFSRNVAEDFEQITGIEANIELVPSIANRQLVSGFSEVGCLNTEPQHACVERQPYTMCLIGCNDGHALQRTRKRNLVSYRNPIIVFRYDLIVVRVRTLNQTRIDRCER